MYAKEKWHQRSVSTTYFLNNELNALEENYLSDADNELIKNEEFSNISYTNNKFGNVFIYTNTNSEIHKVIDSERASKALKQRLLCKFYSWLPEETSTIIDLFVFGKLNFDEIAKVKDTSAHDVKRTIIDVRKMFRKNLV